MTTDLYSLLPKVTISKPPLTEAERREASRAALREYFKTFRKRKDRPLPKSIPRYIVFMEPVPYLSIYREGDEKLGIKHLIYGSFRKARFTFLREVTKWKKKVMSQNTAGKLE